MVDLVVRKHSANVVEYKLCARLNARRSKVASIVCAIAAVCLGIWLSTKHARWLQSAGILAIAGFLWWQYAGRAIVEESVMVIPELGVQLTSRRRNGQQHIEFLPRSAIRSVVINEAITFSSVVYYLAFLVQHQDRMVLAFNHFRLRVSLLQEVLVQIQRALFPSNKEHYPASTEPR